MKFKPTPLSAIFKPVADIQAEREKRQEEINAQPHSIRSFIARGQGMALPPNDPIRLRDKWAHLRKGEDYPGDEIAARKLGYGNAAS